MRFASWDVTLMRRRKISQYKKAAAVLRKADRKYLNLQMKKLSLV